MSRFLKFAALYLLLSGIVSAQSDPLNAVYKPSIDTTCADYPSNVWAANGLTTVYQDVGTAPACVNGATFGAWGTIYATQNEIADVQVFIHDTGAGTSGFQVTVSSFQCTTGPNCGSTQTIAAPDSTHTDIVPYLEKYVNAPVVSGITKTGTPAYLNVMIGSAGHIPDPLIPAIDPYFHQTTNAFPLTVAANQNQGAWIDIHVPSNAKSGYYKGTVTLQSGCTGPYPSTGCATITALPIILAVWQWPSAGFMSSTSSVQSSNGVSDALGAGFFGGTGFDAATGNGWAAPAGNVTTAITLLKENLTVLFLDHRIQLFQPYDVGAPWTSVTTYFKPLLDGTTVSATGAANPILVGASLNTSGWNNDAGSFSATGQAWMTFWNTNGWTAKIDGYRCDEPPNGCGGGVAGWKSLWDDGQVAHAFSPPMPILTTTSFSRLASGNGSGQSETTMCTGGFNAVIAAQPSTCLQNTIDWMVTNDIDMSSSEYANLAAYHTYQAGSSNIGTPPSRRWGSYFACDATGCGTFTGAPSGSLYMETPNLTLDTTAISHRVNSWFMFYAGQTLDLYFDHNGCWAQQLSCGNGGDPFAGVTYVGTNGDGTTIYPGRTSGNTTGFGNVGVSTPIFLPSLRLKHWRDGHQDYEYMAALKANGQTATVTAAINSFMNTAPGGTGVLAWSFNNTQAPVASVFTSDLPDARITLGNALHQISFPTQQTPAPSKWLFAKLRGKL